MMKKKILIVDDEENVLSSLELSLNKTYQVFCAENGRSALEIYKSQEPHLVLLDLGLEDISGLALMRKMKNFNSSPEIIIITATNDVTTAVTAIKQGAFNYITKPYDMDALKDLISDGLAGSRVQLPDSRSLTENEIPFIGESEPIHKIKQMVRKISSNKTTVLITGESGTGKEVVARMIHFSGSLAHEPFVPVHTGAISETLIESELFGHEKGAFTGAVSLFKGKFELADRGTIFLDEISTMPLQLQIKLLRVLQDKTFTRIGGSRPISVDIRVIAASNANLKEEVSQGRFREDLYYRLCVMNIDIPPLRNRRDDILPLCDYFLSKNCREYRKEIKGFSDDVFQVFFHYPWMGNVRELQNVIQRSVILAERDIISLKDLPEDFIFSPALEKQSGLDNPDFRLRIEALNKEKLLRALNSCAWNKVKAAELLGIHRNTINNKIKKYNITVKELNNENL